MMFQKWAQGAFYVHEKTEYNIQLSTGEIFFNKSEKKAEIVLVLSTRISTTSKISKMSKECNNIKMGLCLIPLEFQWKRGTIHVLLLQVVWEMK